MKIALAQINSCIGAFDNNIRKILAFTSKAAEQGCELAIFPELALCGYPPRDLLERKEFRENAHSAALTLAAQTKGRHVSVICGSITENRGHYGNPLYNSALVIKEGRIQHAIHKRLLPTYDIFDETRYFESGQRSVPLMLNNLKAGITICEDIWCNVPNPFNNGYTVNPVKELADAGSEIIITISASPYRKGRLHERREILSGLAKEHGIPFIYINMTGGQDSLIFDGGSMAVAPDGAVRALASDFVEDMVVFDTVSMRGEVHSVSTSMEEEVIKALSCALGDYLEKCGATHVTLGLSGGIDSALTAVIAAELLGPDKVLGILMPSTFTSNESMEDAFELAKNTGIRTEVIPVVDMVDAYKRSMSPLFKGVAEDVAEENIQARIRGNILMAISNKFGHMVLATGNKSELATGYCTLYGDMSGGYALLADVPKTMVYALSRYINRKKEVIPARILSKPPTAELRPGQTDQDELPPYETVDRIIEMYMERCMSIDEICASGIERRDAEQIVRRIVRNEYKRQQAAVGPKITSRSFTRGWQYPVAHCFQDGLSLSNQT